MQSLPASQGDRNIQKVSLAPYRSGERPAQEMQVGLPQQPGVPQSCGCILCDTVSPAPWQVLVNSKGPIVCLLLGNANRLNELPLDPNLHTALLEEEAACGSIRKGCVCRGLRRGQEGELAPAAIAATGIVCTCNRHTRAENTELNPP